MTFIPAERILDALTDEGLSTEQIDRVMRRLTWGEVMPAVRPPVFPGRYALITDSDWSQFEVWRQGEV
jgi:hypothetical protein